MGTCLICIVNTFISPYLLHSVTPTLWMSSFTTSVNLVCGVALWLLPGSSIFSLLPLRVLQTVLALCLQRCLQTPQPQHSLLMFSFQILSLLVTPSILNIHHHTGRKYTSSTSHYKKCDAELHLNIVDFLVQKIFWFITVLPTPLPGWETKYHKTCRNRKQHFFVLMLSLTSKMVFEILIFTTVTMCGIWEKEIISSKGWM